MNILEYNEYLYGTAPAEKCQNALEHHGVKGQEWDKRRYQNLDGSLTPLGRLHYGVGAPREEREAAEEAERRRQEEIDYNRSKSIREMDDDELQAAVARSRMETQFEQNMQNRAVNFMQSQVTEEQLKQQYDDLMYQRSRQKAERFMERVERLARFGGNLASAYGKVVDVKGKIEDVRAKRNLADQEQWKAEQQRTKFEEGEWNFGKKKSEYNMSLQNKPNSLKSDLDEMSGDNKQKSKKELKAEAKAAKKAGKMSDADYDNTAEFWEKEAEAARKSGDKVKEYNAKAMAADAKARKADRGDHEYIRKEGDRYVYDESTTSKWDSTKEKEKSKSLIGRVIDRRKQDKADKVEAKREALKSQARKEIAGKEIENSSSLNSYFGGKDNRKGFEYSTYKDKEKSMYESSPGWKKKVDNEAAHKVEMAKQRRISEALNSKSSSWDSSSLGNLGWGGSSNYNWSTKDVERQMKANSGLNINDAAWKKRKHIKHSEER